MPVERRLAAVVSPLWRVRQAAAYWGVTEREVRRAMSAGAVPFVRIKDTARIIPPTPREGRR